MGLTISHNCWQGPCSSFGDWRKELAGFAGIKLHLMEGYYWPKDQWLDWFPKYSEAQKADIEKYLEIRELPIPWTEYQSDPLVHLLHHSDCNGDIAAEHLPGLLARLEELLVKMPPPRTVTAADINFTPQMKEWGYKLDIVIATTQKIVNEVCCRGRTETFIAGLREAIEAGDGIEFSG